MSFLRTESEVRVDACGQWWRAHTHKLHAAGLSWEAISAGLLVIEWFPYHSKRSALPINPVCLSQQYSFHLAKEMESKIVVGMRSKKHWLNVDPAVEEVSFPKNPQNPHISPANTDQDLFDRIVGGGEGGILKSLLIQKSLPANSLKSGLNLIVGIVAVKI